MGRFETNWLAKPENLATLTDLSGQWIDQVAKRRLRTRVKGLTLRGGGGKIDPRRVSSFDGAEHLTAARVM
jgi:hypothetical protein